MKNTLLFGMLLIMQMNECMDQNQLVQLLGNNGFSLPMTRKVAQSIPLLSKSNVLEENIPMTNATEEQLTFLGEYAPLRYELWQKTLSDKVEKALEEKINKFSLDELALHTVFIGTLYDEVLPSGFVNAWMDKLNVEKVLKGTVDSLIGEQRAEAIYQICWKDPSASDQNGLDPASIAKQVIDNLDIQKKKDEEDSKKSMSNKWSDYIWRKMTFTNFCIFIMGINVILYLSGQKPEVDWKFRI